MNLVDKQILNRLQKGLPVVARPFQALAEEMGVEEGRMLERIRHLMSEGVIRRLGGVFNSQRLGFQSTLVALKAPLERVEELAGVINAYPEVTHHYLRDHEEYTLWFTLIAPSKEQIQEILDKISTQTGLREMHNLPARRLFKIRVDFPL